MNTDKTRQADEVALLIGDYIKRICKAREVSREVALAGAHAQVATLMALTFGPRATATELRRAADQMEFFAEQIERCTTTAHGRA